MCLQQHSLYFLLYFWARNYEPPVLELDNSSDPPDNKFGEVEGGRDIYPDPNTGTYTLIDDQDVLVQVIMVAIVVAVLVVVVVKEEEALVVVLVLVEVILLF